MDLDPTYKDSFNDPLLRVTYDISEQDKKTTEFGIKKMKELMEEMGADIVETSSVAETWGHKHGYGEAAGGVIMGEDPETSAVNNYCQSWEVDNLFVIGASALPHKIPQQTATIGAFAYRAAEGMKEILENGAKLLVDAK